MNFTCDAFCTTAAGENTRLLFIGYLSSLVCRRVLIAILLAITAFFAVLYGADFLFLLNKREWDKCAIA